MCYLDFLGPETPIQCNNQCNMESLEFKKNTCLVQSKNSILMTSHRFENNSIELCRFLFKTFYSFKSNEFWHSFEPILALRRTVGQNRFKVCQKSLLSKEYWLNEYFGYLRSMQICRAQWKYFQICLTSSKLNT